MHWTLVQYPGICPLVAKWLKACPAECLLRIPPGTWNSCFTLLCNTKVTYLSIAFAWSQCLNRLCSFFNGLEFFISEFMICSLSIGNKSSSLMEWVCLWKFCSSSILDRLFDWVKMTEFMVWSLVVFPVQASRHGKVARPSGQCNPSKIDAINYIHSLKLIFWPCKARTPLQEILIY